MEKEDTHRRAYRAALEARPALCRGVRIGGLLSIVVLIASTIGMPPCHAEENGTGGSGTTAGNAPSAASNNDAAAGDPNAPVHAGTETVTVTGEGARAADAPTSFVSVIRPADRPGTIATLADLLGSAVGTRVRSWGGLNAFATVSIRGSTPEQVQVFLDGVPLNSPLGGGVNLADIPLAGVEEIDVHRGFTPASLGSASIGGAVDIRTLPPDGARTLDGTLAYGSYGTGEATGIGTFSTGPMRWVVSGEGSTTRGDFEYWDNNATPYNGADDGYTRRRNNESWTGQVRASGEASFRGGRSLSLAAEWGGRRQGVPGIDSYQSLTATYSMQRRLLRTEMGWSGLAGGRLTLRAGANGEASTGTYQDVDDQLAISPQDTTTRIRAAGLRFLMEADPSRRHHMSLLIEPRREAAEIIDHLAAGPGRVDARRTTLHAVGSDEIRFGSGRFLLAPSLRWEAVANDGAGVAPGAA
ncbi:MAG TPA: TonB-dependent receptor plug domain-containing protein, partial [Candidatus Saccharimonadales bacterium]|nr:TonB-dependent receptor plug domain-containing protein [Candidatus Saccharimonadales bacterium]